MSTFQYKYTITKIHEYVETQTYEKRDKQTYKLMKA